MRFRDRNQAGRLLAERLGGYRDAHPIVLGLTCGGIPVAAEVAAALGAPLEPMVVRTIGAPECPEFAIGAIAEGATAYVNPDALLEAGLRDEDVEAIAEREAAELSRCIRRFRGGHPFPELGGRTVLVVDDGVATGATARAAARAARKAGAARVVLAAPVIAARSAPGLRTDFDDLVAVEYPEPFVAVGVWYERFVATTDEEALAIVERCRGAQAGERTDATATAGEPAGQPREG